VTTPTPLLVLALPVPASALDALDEALAEAGLPAAVEHPAGSATAELRFFADDQAAVEALRAQLAALLPEWSARIGVTLPPPGAATLLPREDWAESWKRHFSTLRVSPRLIIKPSWESVTPGPAERVIELDPGMSFGTGRHATTAGCLRLLDEHTRVTTGAVLDVGCGSGILAIAALRLGCQPVRAYDFDPDAVRVAADNLERNGLRAACELAVVDVLHDNDTRQYRVIMANLMSELLIAAAPCLSARLAPGPDAVLIVAGILREQFPGVVAALQAQGLRLSQRLDEDGWTAGAFSR